MLHVMILCGSNTDPTADENVHSIDSELYKNWSISSFWATFQPYSEEVQN